MIIFLFCILIAILFNNFMGASLGISSLVLTTSGPLFLWCICYIFKNKMCKDKIYKNSLLLIFFSFIIIIFKIILRQPLFVRECIIFIMIPSLFVITFKSLSARHIKYIQVVTLILFVLECGLSIIERIQQKVYFADDSLYSVINKDQDVWSFRSSALFGHPIANSMVVLLMTTFIIFSNLKERTKLILATLSIVAQLCFNTRAGIILTVIILLPFLYEKLKRKSFISKLILFIIIGSVAISIVSLMEKYEVGGRLLNIGNGSLFDDSSSLARLDAFEFYKYLTSSELLWGDMGLYDRLLITMSLAGIENGYIAICLKYGLVFGCVLVILLLRLHISMLSQKYTKWQIFWVLLAIYGYGMTNPHLSNSTIWYIFIFSYFAFSPSIKEEISKK